MPRDLSKMTAEEKEALKARKKAYDAQRQKETYQRKKEAIAQGIPLMARPAPPAPAYKKGMRSDYEENYGDFEPNYKVALAEAKALNYDIEEWKEAWNEEEAKRKKGIPEEFSESDLREFAPYKNLLRNRNGDLMTKDYEWVGKLIIKVKGGKGVETIKRMIQFRNKLVKNNTKCPHINFLSWRFIFYYLWSNVGRRCLATHCSSYSFLHFLNVNL